MDFNKLYLKTSQQINQLITKNYSTSFSSAIILLSKSVRTDIKNIYGFVRVPDELVDSLRPKDCKKQLDDYLSQTYDALKTGVSSNPVIHAFVNTATKYSISTDLIQPFFDSMQSDITKKKYTSTEYQRYIYGSAEVVGLMCLKVFTNGNNKSFQSLKPAASSLGSAFQKINFLRDISSDKNKLGRVYFPNVDLNKLSIESKKSIEYDIKQDLVVAKQMIIKLPVDSRYGVKLAFDYYNALYKKIVRSSPEELLQNRIRINNFHKSILFALCYIQKLLRI
jgi:phytoene/squalene synthetase